MLHRSEPVAVVDSVELPQLFRTVTTGVDGAVFGAAVPLPAALVQPSSVLVTVYTPAVLTVIVDVVAPVLHSNVAAGGNTDNVDVPLQLSTTVTTGIEGAVAGAAIPVPASLVQPFTVFVTV